LQARKKARVYLGQVAEGEDPKAEVDFQTASGTVKKLVDLYIERHAKIKKSSWKEDESILAKAIDAEPNPFIRSAFWLLLLTGLRRNELLNSKWSEVDWKERTLAIGRTKNGEPLLAPLSRAAIARLKTIPRLQDNPHII
jgi:integrase